MTKVIVVNDYAAKLAQLDTRAQTIRARLLELAASRRNLA